MGRLQFRYTPSIPETNNADKLPISRFESATSSVGFGSKTTVRTLATTAVNQGIILFRFFFFIYFLFFLSIGVRYLKESVYLKEV